MNLAKKVLYIQGLLFFLFLTLFVIFYLRKHSTQMQPLNMQVCKPVVPTPLTFQECNPWLLRQPHVKGAEREIARDLEKVHLLSHTVPQSASHNFTQLMIDTLEKLHAQLPFQFPDHLYNVLCIPEAPTDAIVPYQVYQRLYLAETEWGFPCYLDVRVFELSSHKSESIIQWHLEILEGTKETLYQSDTRSAFICRGIRNSNRVEATHGFASLLGERALFLDFYQKEERLYVCYAEAPLSTFVPFESLFRSLALQPEF